MSEWQPIETAPKDGTVIRLYGFSVNADGWFADGEWKFLDIDEGHALINGWEQGYGPTHWQSLPDHPRDSEEMNVLHVEPPAPDYKYLLTLTTNHAQELRSEADFLERINARLWTALEGMVKDCPDCGGKETAYMMMDETEISQAPGSSGQDCRRCAPGRAALSDSKTAPEVPENE